MRLLIWNCCNGLSHPAQIEQFQSYKADIAILPELRERNIENLCPESNVWVTNNMNGKSPKGLGVLAFNGYSLQLLPRDEEMEIYLPIQVRKGKLQFKLMAVWNFYHKCKQGRFRGLKGDSCLENAAIEYYKNFLNEPAILAGDFNFGPTFSQKFFLKMCGILGERGMRSLYHKNFSLPESDSNHPTFRTPNKKFFHHLDHCFGSLTFQNALKNLHVERFENVIRSDHASLLVEFSSDILEGV